MTTIDKIIEMARQADIWWDTVDDCSEYRISIDDLERFYTLVRNAALEEAAVVCDAVSQEANLAWRSAYRTLDQGIERGADDCADTIRNLKETK